MPLLHMIHAIMIFAASVYELLFAILFKILYVRQRRSAILYARAMVAV